MVSALFINAIFVIFTVTIIGKSKNINSNAWFASKRLPIKPMCSNGFKANF